MTREDVIFNDFGRSYETGMGIMENRFATNSANKTAGGRDSWWETQGREMGEDSFEHDRSTFRFDGNPSC